jgi:hypothetical protein
VRYSLRARARLILKLLAMRREILVPLREALLSMPAALKRQKVI